MGCLPGLRSAGLCVGSRDVPRRGRRSAASPASRNASRLGGWSRSGPVVGATASSVFRPSPVLRTTVVSDGSSRPVSISFLVTPTVTPPAVSAKMPSVRASSLIASTTCSSLTSSTAPPVRRAMSSTYGPSAGLPMASDLAMVFGFCGRTTSWPALKARRDRRAALGLGAEDLVRLVLDEAELDQLLEPLVDLRELRAGGDRDDDLVRQPPAELLADLVRQRLGALAVVRPEVDVDEAPALAERVADELGAEAVDVVVVALDADQVAAVDRGHDDLALPPGRAG